MIIILTCLLGTFFVYKKKINIFIFIFIFSLLLMPLLTYKFNPTWFQYRGYVPIFLVGILGICKADILLRNTYFKQNMYYLFFLIAFFFTVLVLASIINDYNFISACDFFKNYFWPFLFYIIIASLGESKLGIHKYLMIFVILMIVLSVLQFVDGETIGKWFAYNDMIKDGKIVKISSIYERTKGALITGTLGKVTVLGNFLAIYVTYFFSRKIMNGICIKDILFIITIIGIIISTGVRASLITCFTGLLLCFIFLAENLNSSLKRFFIIFLISIISLPILISIGQEAINSKLTTYNNPIMRSFSVFGVLSEFGGDESPTHLYTLQRSINISNFFSLDTLLFGTGIYTRNPKGYGPGIASITDAQLLFILIEYGLFVLMLCIFPYIYCLKKIKQSCNKIVFKRCAILFGIIFMQTIVDQGIFDSMSQYIIFLIFAEEENHRHLMDNSV